MSIFGESQAEKDEFKIIYRLLENESRLLKIVEELLPHESHKHKVRLVLNQKLNNNSIFQIMALTLVSNQQVAGTLGLVDQVTNLPVSGTFAGTSAASDTAAAFTASVDASGSVVVAGVAAGTGNLSVSTTATYTDSTGAAQTAPLAVTIPVTITAVVTADAVSLVVNFGTPTAQ